MKNPAKPVSIDLAALILRVGAGSYMLFGHGLGKAQKLFAGGEIHFSKVFGLSPVINLVLASFAEAVCAALVIIGFQTRLASIPLIITMLVAAFMIHGQDPWFSHGASGGSKEFAMIYLIPFLAIFFTGSGKYSIDGMRK